MQLLSMQRCLRQLLLLLTLGIDSVGAAAVPSNWAPQLKQPILHTIGAAQGLGNSLVVDARQDQFGFLWFATEGGLYRWDGHQFREYSARPGQPLALQDNFVSVLGNDTQGQLWVGMTSGGLARYDATLDGFVAFTPANSHLSAGAVSAIVADNLGTLWVGTENGLDRLAPGAAPARAVLQHFSQNDGLPSNFINALRWDAQGTLWVGTAEGLARRERHATRFSPLALPGLPHGTGISSLFIDSQGTLWIGTPDGVFLLEPQTDRPLRLAANGKGAALMLGRSVNGIVEAEPGTIWISTTNHGLTIVDRAHDTIQHFRREEQAPAGSLAELTRALYRDTNGQLWLASDSGLSKYQGTPAVLDIRRSKGAAAGLSHSDITTLASTADGRLWGGGSRYGIDLIEPEAGKVRPWRPRGSAGRDFFQKHNINSLATGQDDSLWLATSDGLYRSADGGASASKIQAPWLDYRWFVRKMLSQGEYLWLGTATQGLFQARPGPGRTLQKVRHIEGLSGVQITTLYPDTSGNLWVGTTSGLHRVDPASGRVLEHIGTGSEALSNPYVTAILQDHAGRLWIASNGGIDIMLPTSSGKWRRTQHLGLAQGLPDLAIATLLSDTQQRIWSSSDRGISVIDSTTYAINTLHHADGVRHAPYWMGVGLVRTNGDLVFSGTNGLTIIRPALYRPWNYRPPVVITALQLGGKTLSAGLYNMPQPPTLTIQPDANSLNCEFAALDYTSPHQNRYAYRLEGYAQDWTPVDVDHRSVNYTNLAPGRYRLQMQGSNRNGSWSEAPRQISIVVLPHWYQTWWCYLALGLLFLSSLYAAARWRNRQLATQRNALEQQVAERTAEVLQEKLNAEQEQLHAQARNAELSTINMVAQLLAGKLDTTAQISQVGAHLQRVFHADYAAIAILDARGELQYPYRSGMPMPHTQPVQQIPYQVLRSNLAQLWSEPSGAGLCVPIIAQGDVLGVVLVHRRSAHGTYGSDDQRVLDTIAAHLGAALQNAQLFQQAEAARIRAEAATHAKSVFIANISHEIRTPMNAVIGLSHLALSTSTLARQRDYLQKIHHAGKSLLGIISDVLDFSKIEAGKLALQCADFNLDEMLAHVAAISSASGNPDIECNFDIAADVPRQLYGDMQRLSQVLINLLSNALKFTEQGDVLLRVRVLAQQDQRVQLELAIHDTGIGMSASEVERLFQPFTQIDSSTTRKFGGSGLGLSICKTLMNLMGGSLHVTSELGAGSCFSAQLWLGYAGESSIPEAPLPAALHSVRVLIVDPHQHARSALLNVCQRLGLSALAVPDTITALQQLPALSPPANLLLVDAQLPLADLIAATNATPSLRLALLWRNSEAVACDVLPGLVKPLTHSSLYDLLRQLFLPAHGAQSGAGAAPAQYTGVRILLAEDHPVNQEIASGLLEAAGITVDIAPNGHVAIEKLQASTAENAYQLVFIDWQMPELDGLTTTQRLRQDGRFSTLPIIALTANADADQIRQVQELGFNDHLAKPIDPAQLYRLLQRHLDPSQTIYPPRHKDGQAVLALAPLHGLDLEQARRSVHGDEALLHKVLRLFQANSQQNAVQIGLAFACDDLIGARCHAHALRGVAESLGAQQIVALAAALEQQARTGGPSSSSVQLLLQQLHAALSALATQLDNHLPQHDTARPALHAGSPTVEWSKPLSQLAALIRAKDVAAGQLMQQLSADMQHSFGLWDSEAIEHSLRVQDYDGADIALRWLAHKHQLDLATPMPGYPEQPAD